ncbi:MAG: hypothetical protein IKE42_28270 [Aquamicrobium sp.]|nr:hypothetical protein [Aquamicrobium sp.]
MLGQALALSPGHALPAFTAMASRYFAAMSTPPTEARKRLCNNFFGALDNAGITPNMGAFWILAGHDSQATRLNVINPALYTLTPVNSPVHTVDRGWNGDAVTSYLDTGYNPISAAFMQQDNHHFAVFSLTNNSNTAYKDFGGRMEDVNIVGTPNFVGSRSASLNIRSASSTIPTSVALVGISRSSSSSYRVNIDGVLNSTITETSSGLSNSNYAILAKNNNGTIQGYSARRVGIVSVGRNLSTGQWSAYNAAARAYLTGIGAL